MPGSCLAACRDGASQRAATVLQRARVAKLAWWGEDRSGWRVGRLLSVWPALQLVQSFAEPWQPASVPHTGTAHLLAFEVFNSREHRHPQEVFFLGGQTLGRRYRDSHDLLAVTDISRAAIVSVRSTL